MLLQQNKTVRTCAQIDSLETRLQSTDTQVARLEATHRMHSGDLATGILDPMAAQSLQMASEATLMSSRTLMSRKSMGRVSGILEQI